MAYRWRRAKATESDNQDEFIYKSLYVNIFIVIGIEEYARFNIKIYILIQSSKLHIISLES